MEQGMTLENLNLLATVKPGTVSTNFDEFKEIVRKKLDEDYKSIEATEESIQEARKARATLNKAKESLKDTMRSAAAQNDEPLKLARMQAKELEALLDDAINHIDVQIKAIEERQRNQRMRKAMDVLAGKVDRLEDASLATFISGCVSWIQKDYWKNAGTTFMTINTDCDKAIELCRQALEILEGDYRAEMLAEFQRTGDLAQAQMVGKRLRTDKERMAAITGEDRREDPPAEPTNIPKTENKETQNMNTTENRPERPVDVPEPLAFRKDERSDRQCRADFRLQGQRYVMEWFMEVCRRFDISLTRLD